MQIHLKPVNQHFRENGVGLNAEFHDALLRKVHGKVGV